MHTVLKRNNAANTYLVVGPWAHGGWARGNGDRLGAIRFASNTSVFYRTEVELPFFNFYLKDKGQLDLPRALVFETGRNEWRRSDQWPPAGTSKRAFYLHPGGRLSFDAPGEMGSEASDTYVSDPARPVPYTAEIRTTEGQLFTVEDQRFASRRPDVLVYETEPLTAPLTIAGPVEADLYVSTTGTDSDWIVKLIDVYPDGATDAEPDPASVRMGGYQMLLAGDILRAKFRDSFSTPMPMTPGKPARLRFELGDRYHTFLQGHRVMVQIQSSWFPMFDRNPQKFVDIYHATPSEYAKATQAVYRTRTMPSSVSVQIVR
jgi:putative CocE/NonD family hydrolase